jgi:adenylate cyclase
MGNAVNLASRLETINKQYGTWVIISETTQESIGRDFALRRLDRVRVVGISKPVRLYELVEEAGHVEPVVAKTLAAFEEALQIFETKDWQKAEKAFTHVLELSADDGPSKVYIKRCQEYAAKPPASNWDGVFNLTNK